MQILVTGASGFIGSNLVRALIKAGHQVRILVRNFSKLDRLRELSEDKIEVIAGDLSDKKILVRAVSGVEIVLHLAGVLGRFGLSKEVYYSTHIRGTRNILDVCRQLSSLRQFILCSTIGVLGPCLDKPFTESQGYNPTNIYEQTKTEAEKLVVQAITEGFPATIIRPGLVYGPYDIHVLQMFRAIKNRKFFLIGQGKNIIQPVYIDDLVRGFLLVLNNPRAIGQTYHIAGEELVESARFFQVIADSVGVKLPRLKIPIWFAYLVLYPLIWLAKIFHFEPILTKSRLRFFIDSHKCLINKAKDELNYQPRINLEQGIELTAAFYKERGYL